MTEFQYRFLRWWFEDCREFSWPIRVLLGHTRSAIMRAGMTQEDWWRRNTHDKVTFWYYNDPTALFATAIPAVRSFSNNSFSFPGRVRLNCDGSEFLPAE